jgi:ABC-type lipoprotein release transport system permease subunit
MTGRVPLTMLLRMAVSSARAHRVKSLLVGGIIGFGALLVVVGNSLLDSVTVAMSRSIVRSIAGHVQVYSAEAKDDIALFGGMMMGAEDVGEIDRFDALTAALSKVDNVEAVVPMGIDTALVYTGNPIDTMLADLREAVRTGEPKALQARREHVRRIVSVLEEELGQLDEIATEGALSDEEKAAVSRANSPEFWAEFDRDPLTALEFLDNRIAPLSLGEQMRFYRYVGTDLQAFQKNFELFEIVDGTNIPEGKRGFLFSKFVYETINKHPVAFRIDEVGRKRENGDTLAQNAELAQRIQQNIRQYKDILYELDPSEAAEVETGLRTALGAEAAATADLPALMQQFLAFDDANYEARRKVFYDLIAPRIRLYQVPVGSTLTVTAFGRTGYLRNVNVPVYGTFQFKSLEKSALSGSFNLMDLVTFRDLYGFRGADADQELAQLKEKANVLTVDRDNAEDLLFGGDADTVVEAKPEGFNEFAGVDMKSGRRFSAELLDKVYSQAEIEGGVVLNAAVLLRDPDRIEETRKAIEDAGTAAGIPLKTATWTEASGIVGQFISVTRLSLYVAILIIFVVALLIVNIATLMAALERVTEIGTMRAIGASRGFVLALFLTESTVVALFGGALGSLVGVGIILWLGSVGIPATTDIFYFLFSGPRLFPTLSTSTLAVAVGVLLLVSVLASLYPALLATRVTPLSAMQKEN